MIVSVLLDLKLDTKDHFHTDVNEYNWAARTTLRKTWRLHRAAGRKLLFVQSMMFRYQI